jgi:hypothetical protein
MAEAGLTDPADVPWIERDGSWHKRFIGIDGHLDVAITPKDGRFVSSLASQGYATLLEAKIASDEVARYKSPESLVLAPVRCPWLRSVPTLLFFLILWVRKVADPLFLCADSIHWPVVGTMGSAGAPDSHSKKCWSQADANAGVGVGDWASVTNQATGATIWALVVISQAVSIPRMKYQKRQQLSWEFSSTTTRLRYSEPI